MVMGKRSNFERKARDFYPTPYEAVVPLLPHLPKNSQFHEPCSGDGDLIEHLELNGHNCITAGDISNGHDALEITHTSADIFITNPPWDRKILHPLITHLSSISPTWLLFDADWMHTKQSIPYMHLCKKVISVGRIKWIPDSKMTGKDNCAWYLFDQDSDQTKFFGRR
tara:strand:- start:1887 stop:2390 length:504 start_codon:yes stop_codon:yes gene_type:complete